MMAILLYAFAFAYGSVFGSFACVVATRLPVGEQFVRGRSRCGACGHVLRWHDLVPVVSWLALRGKCRDCGAAIGVREVAAEAALGALFCLALWRFGLSWYALAVCGFFVVLAMIFMADTRYQLIPDGLNAAVAVIGVCAYFARWGSPLPYVAGAFVVSVPVLLVAWRTGGFGGGDVKLFAAAGLFLGWKLALLAAVLAFVIGGAAGAALLITKRAGRKTKIAFGPYICVGAAAAALWGDAMIAWYFRAL